MQKDIWISSEIQMHFTDFFLQPKTHLWKLCFPSNTPSEGQIVEILKLGLFNRKEEKQYLLNT